MPPFLLSIAERYVRPVFSTTFNFISWAPRLAVARLFAKWRSLVTIIIGVILGAGIGALVPLYTTAIAQVGMIQRFEQELAHDVNARLRVSLRPSDFASITDMQAAATTLDETIVTSTTQHLEVDRLEGWLRNGRIVPFTETDKMGVLITEEDPLQLFNTTQNARASLIAMDNWEDEVRVVQGTLPSRTTLPEGVDFNVAISLTASNEFGLSAGDTLIVDQRLSRDGSLNPGAWESSQPFTVLISAIVAPQDETSAYWMAVRGDNDTPLAVVQGSWPAEFRMLVDEATIMQVMESYVPQTPLTYGWRILFNHAELPYSRIDEARTALYELETVLYNEFVNDRTELVQQLPFADSRTDTDLQYDYHTRLIDYSQTRADVDNGIMQDYAKKQDTNAVPFTLLLLEVGALVIFFLIVTAALVRRGERREIAMLQSRGAFDGHILALRGIEALLICVFGAVVAPSLTQQLLIALGPSIANTEEFPLPLTNSVFIFSTLAATVTFVALTLTLVPVLRLPLIQAGGTASRSGKMAWWQKYYLDVVLAAVGLIALFLLIDRDTPLLESSGTEQKIDPLLVLAPALLFLGLGSIALRLFPLATHGLALLSNRRHGVLEVLSTWQLSREPIHYGRITFLLALAVGIGWFATSFRATVSRSQTDQAHYQVGTDVRMMERDTSLNVDRVRPAEYYTSADEVQAASVAYRGRINLISRTGNSPYRSGEVIGIDSSTFGGVALEDWRPDLGNIRVPYPAETDLNLAVVGQYLPTQPSKIGIWARLDVGGFGANFGPDLQRLTQRVRLGIRLQDDAGAWMLLPFEQKRIEYLRGTLTDAPGFGAAAHVSNGWVYYEADLSKLTYVPQGRLRLVSIYWEHRSNNTGGEANIRMVLADLNLIDNSGVVEPLPILQEGSWRFVYDSGATSQGTIQPATAFDNLHDDAIYVVFNQDALRTKVGINLNYPSPPPMWAVVSQTMVDINSLEIPEPRIDEATGEEIIPEPQPFVLYNVAGANVTVLPYIDTEYFPSLYNEQRPFVVVDVRELMYWLNERPAAQIYPNEVWLELQDDIEGLDAVTDVMDSLTGLEGAGVVRSDEETFAQVYDKLETDPLALGLLGLMFLAFLISLALSIVGLVTYTALTAQARRGEFGVLRALGLSSSRVVRSLVMEQVVVVGIAGALGSILGFLLSVFVVPTLALGTTGEGVVPPFITQTEWGAVANFWLIMGLVVIGVFIVSVGIVRQLSLSRTLRLGDE